MRVTIEKVDLQTEEEIIARCHNPDSNWVKAVISVQQEGLTISGKKDDQLFNINIKNIYYFECVDNHSFFYTKDSLFESKLKVYEFEKVTQDAMFFKVSKSTVVNIRKIKSIKPSYSGKFELTLLNEYKLMVSRMYVRELKTIMGV